MIRLEPQGLLVAGNGLVGLALTLQGAPQVVVRFGQIRIQLQRLAVVVDGCIVVIGNLPSEEYWLAAGVYTDHWMLREGILPLPAGRLLAQPGVVDLAGRR